MLKKCWGCDKMNMFSEKELEKLLVLVSGELFHLEKHDRKDTNEYMELKRIQNKLMRLVCRKA